jgi:hypothetical protein
MTKFKSGDTQVIKSFVTTKDVVIGSAVVQELQPTSLDERSTS